MSLKTVNVLGFATTGAQFNVKTRNLDIKISKNPQDAALEGPSPIEYVLAGFAGCINAVGTLVARELQLDLKALQVEITAGLDTDKYNGLPTKVRAGFKSIQILVKPTADASPEVLRDWLTEVERRCPVQDNLVNPTPVNIALEYEPETVALAG